MQPFLMVTFIMMDLKKNLQNCGIKTAAELAEIMGVTPPTVHQWLHGKPKVDTLQKIADKLNVPLSAIMADENDVIHIIKIACPHCGEINTITLKIN